jgi:Protein of unknown function (DUF3617)
MFPKAAFAAALILSAGPALAQQTILPGYWESTSSSRTSLSKSDPKTERRCITPDKVNAYLSGPSTSHYTCTYSSRTIQGGVADFKGQCVDKHGTSFDVAMHGTYSPEAFHLDARFVLPNLPMFGGSASTDAHRISADCPAAQ